MSNPRDMPPLTTHRDTLCAGEGRSDAYLESDTHHSQDKYDVSVLDVAPTAMAKNEKMTSLTSPGLDAFVATLGLICGMVCVLGKW